MSSFEYIVLQNNFESEIIVHQIFYILSGILKLNKALDREKTPTLEVTVIAKDNVDPKLSSTATVSITVQDVNDNTPMFATYKLSYKVKEDAAVGKVIATISATDEDSGAFGNIVYSFDVTNDDDKLKLNKLNVSTCYIIYFISACC